MISWCAITAYAINGSYTRWADTCTLGPLIDFTRGEQVVGVVKSCGTVVWAERGMITALKYDPVATCTDPAGWALVPFPEVTPIPEPTTYLMLLGGLMILAALGRVRRTQ